MFESPGTPLTRRQALRLLGGGVGGVALAPVLARPLLARGSDDGEPKPPHFPARAKRVLLFYEQGRPGASMLRLLTGSSKVVRPSLGAWVVHGRGSENQDLPGFVTIAPAISCGGAANWSAQHLPAHCQGAPIDALDDKNARLLLGLDRADVEVAGAAYGDRGARLAAHRRSRRLQDAARELYCGAQESPVARRLYQLDQPSSASDGRTFLAARRLLERGVRFVQCYGSVRAALVLPGLAADLEWHGLLADTLMLRARWTEGESRSDPGTEGAYVIDTLGRPPAVFGEPAEDLHATVLRELGLDPARLGHPGAVAPAVSRA